VPIGKDFGLTKIIFEQKEGGDKMKSHPEQIEELLRIEKQFYKSLEDLFSDGCPNLNSSEMRPTGCEHEGGNSQFLGNLRTNLLMSNFRKDR
jgi:hypothetical protein